MVWVLYARVNAGAPALGSHVRALGAPRQADFPFWDQFDPDGSIRPMLPADSSWKAIGPPVPVEASASQPGVATWTWTVPRLRKVQGRHYCLAIFLHGSRHAIAETATSLDEITKRNPQVRMKNLHILRSASTTRAISEDGSGGEAGAGGGQRGKRRRERIYVEFHNADASTRRATLRFDLQQMPTSARLRIRLAGEPA